MSYNASIWSNRSDHVTCGRNFSNEFVRLAFLAVLSKLLPFYAVQTRRRDCSTAGAAADPYSDLFCSAGPPMRLRLLAAAALAAAQIYRPDGAQTPFKKSIHKSVQRKISSSSHHISDGEHIKLDDGNLPSEIFLGRHTIKKPWTLGKYENNVITVEDMYRIILKKKTAPRLGRLPGNLPQGHGSHESIHRIYMWAQVQGRNTRSDRGPAQVPGILVGRRRILVSLPYRMVDGAHRICRMKAAGISQGCFFVLDEATALSLVVPYPAHGAKAQRIKPIGRYEAIALGWKLAMDYGIDGIDADCEKRANWTLLRPPRHRRCELDGVRHVKTDGTEDGRAAGRRSGAPS